MTLRFLLYPYSRMLYQLSHERFFYYRDFEHPLWKGDKSNFFLFLGRMDVFKNRVLMYFPSNVRVFNVRQRSDEWKFLRGSFRTPLKGKIPEDWLPYITPFRFTASEIYCLTDKSPYKSRDKYFGEVLGLIPKTFTGNVHTERGQRLEPKIREMYEGRHSVLTEEVGFVIPDWCPYIGVSPDGLLEDGCIEIKSPVSVYRELLEDGEVKGEHYAQMQMAMIICDRPWCDYVVYSERQDLYFEKRVDKNLDYWNEELYPVIQKAIEDGRWVVASEMTKNLPENFFD